MRGSPCDALTGPAAMNPVAPTDDFKSHIRPVPDRPAPGVQFRNITPLQSNRRLLGRLRASVIEGAAIIELPASCGARRSCSRW
jgi:molybdopterin biosynthesis enzyme MoaB